MWKRNLRACRLSLGVMLALAGLGPSWAHSLKDLEEQLQAREMFVEIVHRAAPAFKLKNAHGETVRLADLRSKVVVLWFVYTRCPDVCPLHSEALAHVQEKVNLTPTRDLVAFVAITTDPEHDTMPIIEDYGPAHGLDPANWIMLTSGPGAPSFTRKLAEAYGLKFTPAEDGYQMHGVVTHLIDKSGNLRARYHGLRFNPTNLIIHINALANDDH